MACCLLALMLAMPTVAEVSIVDSSSCTPECRAHTHCIALGDLQKAITISIRYHTP
jgi:hypothetical protein